MDIMDIITATFWVYLKCILYTLVIYTVFWSITINHYWQDYRRLTLHIVVSGYFFIQLITLLISLSGKSIAFAISITDPLRTISLILVISMAWANFYLGDRRSSQNLIRMSKSLLENKK